MDRKRTQRILGILVIIALVIILFPLMFGKNEAPTQITSVAPPPFPDQQQAVMPAVAESNNDPINSVPAEQNTHGTQSPANTDSNAITPEQPSDSTQPSQPSENNASTLPHTAPTSPINDVQGNNNAEIAPAIALEMDNKITPEVQALKTAKPDDTISPDLEARKILDEPVVPVVNQTAIKSISLTKTKAKKTITAKVKPSSSKETLVKLNSPAWAVQMGSFKNKENARVLADRLRSAGFKAFTKEVKSAKGAVQTRVYIGPEFQQASAIKLNADVQQTLHMQGVVIAYKPLAL